MADDIINVRLPRAQALFLQANLSVLAANTRQAMTRPGIDPERRQALGCRAALLERIEDSVLGAMLDGSDETRRSNRGVEMGPRTRRHDFQCAPAA